jgi:hypothetical protein
MVRDQCMSNCLRREPYFSPSFSHISPPNDPDLCHFYMNRLHFNKNSIATKMGQNGAVLGQILHFDPFPLQKINKRGAEKVENQPSPNLLFKTQDDKVS